MISPAWAVPVRASRPDLAGRDPLPVTARPVRWSGRPGAAAPCHTRHAVKSLALCVGLLLGDCASRSGGSEPLDLVLERGEVVDGTGAPRVRADVGVRGDRIVSLGDLSSAPARRRIDASG